jgi:hypothetical protein
MSTMEQTYKTPEGFELYKRLLMPEARSFADVLTFVRPWDFATMSHKNGYPQADTPRDTPIPGTSRLVSHFCAVRNLEGRQHMQVDPTSELMALLETDDFAFFDRVSFEAICHESNDRVLIVASASGIIASRWLAYVDPATVPGGGS